MEVNTPMQADVISSRQTWNSFTRLPMYVHEHSTHSGRVNRVSHTIRMLMPSTARWYSRPQRATHTARSTNWNPASGLKAMSGQAAPSPMSDAASDTRRTVSSSRRGSSSAAATSGRKIRMLRTGMSGYTGISVFCGSRCG